MSRRRQQLIRAYIQKQHPRSETSLDYICGRLEDGEFLKDISAEIERATQQPVPHHSLRRWLEDEFGKPEVIARFEEARKHAADSHAAEGYHILDTAPDIREAIDRAKAKAAYKQWLAERSNKERWGNAVGANVNVTLNVAQLHLQALRQRSVDSTTAAPIAEPPSLPVLPAVDAEIVSD